MGKNTARVITISFYFLISMFNLITIYSLYKTEISSYFFMDSNPESKKGGIFFQKLLNLKILVILLLVRNHD